MLPYGEWGKWLKEEVSYSQRTAEHLMRIYLQFGPNLAPPGEGLPDSNPDSNLSGLAELQSIQLPVLVRF